MFDQSGKIISGNTKENSNTIVISTEISAWFVNVIWSNKYIKFVFFGTGEQVRE